MVKNVVAITAKQDNIHADTFLPEILIRDMMNSTELPRYSTMQAKSAIVGIASTLQVFPVFRREIGLITFLPTRPVSFFPGFLFSLKI